MNKFVLLTGGLGYIGSHTAVSLIQKGYQIVIVDNLSNSSIRVIDQIKTITGVTPIFHQADIADYPALLKCLKQYPISAVIHFAGFKAVGESVADPLKYFQNNISGTISLLQAMQHCRIQNLVFSSSATVYGHCEQMPLTEQSPTATASPYGTTKLMIEQILSDLAKHTPHWAITILRYFNPVGAHSSGLMGESPLQEPQNLMPFITQVAVRKLSKLKIFGNDYPTADGTGVRDYIHVVDLAEAHLAALEKLQPDSETNIYNLGTGEGHSVLQVVETFQQVNSISVPFEITERRPGDVATCYAEVSKARKKLNWQAKFSLHDICEDAWRWQQNYPNGL